MAVVAGPTQRSAEDEKTTQIWPRDFDKDPRTVRWNKDSFFTNGARTLT